MRKSTPRNVAGTPTTPAIYNAELSKYHRAIEVVSFVLQTWLHPAPNIFRDIAQLPHQNKNSQPSDACVLQMWVNWIVTSCNFGKYSWIITEICKVVQKWFLLLTIIFGWYFYLLPTTLHSALHSLLTPLAMLTGPLFLFVVVVGFFHELCSKICNAKRKFLWAQKYLFSFLLHLVCLAKRFLLIFDQTSGFLGPRQLVRRE